MNSLHCHSKCTFFRVCAGEGKPCDVEWVGERSECLRPDYTEVAETLIADLCEDAVEDVG